MKRKKTSRLVSEKVGERVRILCRQGIWYANYQSGRRQVRESLGTRSKKEAERKAHAIDRRLAAGEQPETRKPCTVAEAIAEYKDYVQGEGRRPKTQKKYFFTLALFQTLADELRLILLSQLDLRFADKFKSRRMAECTAKTVYFDLVLLRQFMKFAVSRKLVSSDPLQGMKVRKPKPTPQPCFNDDQVRRILAAASDAHRATFLVLAETGMRIGEAQWLTWDDVDFEKNVLHIRAKDDWKPKSGDSRSVPMSPTLRKFLSTHPSMGRFVLSVAATAQHPQLGRQISERRALVALKRVLEKLKIPGKLHTFRHYFISRCLTSGIEESVVRSWVGHVDPEIMRLYTHISSTISQDRIQRLGGAGNGEEKAALSDG